MSAFIERHGVGSFDHVVDPEGSDASIWARFGIVTQPAWIFVNDDGTSKTLVGPLGEDGLNREIDALQAN
ncbi:hypothetical protein [Actinospongicola halichondriae]|uniref:hypothetical protein n=1 Tax=Actinospongicola halichondriae TaxID=3236844 RepID=UPI003D41C663